MKFMRPLMAESLLTLTKSMHTCAICLRDNCLFPSGTNVWIHGWTSLVMLLFQRCHWTGGVMGWVMLGTSEHHNASFSPLVSSFIVTISGGSWDLLPFLGLPLGKIFVHTRLTPVVLADVHSNRSWQLLEGRAGYLLFQTVQLSLSQTHQGWNK